MKRILWFLIFFLSSLVVWGQEPALSWGYKMGVYSGYDEGTFVAMDNESRTALVGSFNGRIKLGSEALESGDYNAILVCRWNAQNVLEWAVGLPGSGTVFPAGLALDPQGNIYFGGNFENTLDADPGPGIYNLYSEGNTDGFIIKLNPDGQFLWAARVGGGGYDFLTDIACDDAGIVGVSGYFRGVVDFDPGPGVDEMSSDGNQNSFVWMLDADGNHRWVKGIPAESSSFGYTIAIDGTGNVLVSGQFAGTADFDPGPDTLWMTAELSTAVFLQKLSPEGDLVWARTYGVDFPTDVDVDAAGNVYTAGAFESLADFDPGTGEQLLTSNGYLDIFVQKINADGSFAWAVSYGSEVYDIPGGLAVNDAGQVYVTGTFDYTTDFNPGAGNFSLTPVGLIDVFVQKLSTEGVFAWVKRLGGLDYESGNHIFVHTDGTVLTTGSFEGAVDFDPGAGVHQLVSKGSSDIFVQKMSANGAYLWAGSIGSAGGEIWPYGIAADFGGNTVLGGYVTGEVDVDPTDNVFELKSLGSVDGYLRKADKNGQLLWAVAIGGSEDDLVKTLTIDGENNILAAGYFTGIVDFDPGPGEHFEGTTGMRGWFVLKLDPDGHFVWVKTMLGESFGSPESILLDSEGNLYLTGFYDGTYDFDPGPGTVELTSVGYTDIVLLKLDGDGNFLWGNSTGGDGFDAGTSLAVDGSGNVYCAGTFEGIVDFDPGPGDASYDASYPADNFFEKWDAQGNFQWSVFLSGNSEMGYEPQIASVNNGKIWVAGGFHDQLTIDPAMGWGSLSSNGGSDAYLILANADGQITEAFQFGSFMSDEITALAVDASNNLFVTGTYQDLVDFDPSDTGEYKLYSEERSAFIFQIDNNDQFQWAVEFASDYIIEYPKMTIDADDDLVSTGFFRGTVDADPSLDVNTLYSNNWNTYVIKLDLASSGIPNFITTQTLRAWPNPTTGPLTIDLGDQPLDVEVTVTGVEGKLLKRLYFENAQLLDVPLDGLMPGVYFVGVRGEGILATVRAVKE